jgi:hypothetical protein
MGEIHVSFIGKAIGKITGAQDQADAIRDGAQTQAESADKGIAAQQLALEQFRQALAPYVNAGTGALTGQQDLLGLNGASAQSSAINGIQASPQFAALQKQGNDAILANASATGGLRGGNVQGALAQFSPTLLAQLIDQQYSRLGGLTSLGQSSAAGVGNAGMQTGSAVSSLLQQQGAAIAGGQIAQGSVARQGFGDLLKIGSMAAGMYGMGGMGGAGASVGATPQMVSSGQF